MILTWALLLSQLYFSVVYKESIIDEPTLYLIIDIVAFGSFSHLIWYVIDELKEIRNINMFIITRPLREVDD